MPVMEVVLQQSYAGQEIINRFNYVSSGTPASVTHSFALASALGAIYDNLIPGNGYPTAGLMNLIAGLQVIPVVFDFLLVRDVYSNTDFYEVPFLQPLVGQRTGEGLSPASATGFRSNRVRTDVRRGMKRFVGVPETASAAAGVLTSDYINNQCIPAANALGAVVTYDDEGNTITFTPAVCGKEAYPVPDSGTPPRTAYRYWPSEAVQLEHTAIGVKWDPYTTVRTQTSRQYGRGR